MAKGIIVDDAPIMRLKLRQLLEREHEIIDEGGTGQDAITLYREHKPDFMTLDITMPELDGMSALQQIAAEFPEPRVVIISAVGQEKQVLDAVRIGAADFVVKPYDKDDKRDGKRVSEAVKKAVARVKK